MQSSGNVLYNAERERCTTPRVIAAGWMGAEGVDPVATALQALGQTHQSLIIICDESRPCLNRIMRSANTVPPFSDMVVTSYVGHDFC